MDLAVVVVPGWDYVESGPETGADFARQLRQFSELGIASYRVPLDPSGSVEENASLIRCEIARIGQIHEDLIVVSASSGGPAAALALGEPSPSTDLGRVRAWLNMGGILGGMPLIDSYSGGISSVALRLFTWANGWDLDRVKSMSAARSRERLSKIELPPDMVVINYIGIPFSGDISNRATFFYSQLRKLGPNDGLTLVADPVLPGTRTIVALGQDHFFADDPEIESRTLALASLVGRAVARKRSGLQVASSNGAQRSQLCRLEPR